MAGSERLIFVDQAPIREAEERRLESVYRLLAACEAEFSDHETIQIPAFRQWMALSCADLLDHRRLLELKLRTLRIRLSAVHRLREEGFRHIGEAYHWFSEIEREETAIPPRVLRAWEQVTFTKADGHEEGVTRSSQSEREIDDSASSNEEEEENWENESSGSEKPSKDADQEELETTNADDLRQRCKDLYRKIVRSLHPDAAGTLSDKELALWYATQEAYEFNDSLALETILARCDRVGTRHLTIWELRERNAEAEDRLGRLRESIAGMKSEPSWKFLELAEPSRTALLRTVRRDLEKAIEVLSEESIYLERQLDFLRKRAKRWLQIRREKQGQLLLL